VGKLGPFGHGSLRMRRQEHEVLSLQKNKWKGEQVEHESIENYRKMETLGGKLLEKSRSAGEAPMARPTASGVQASRHAPAS